MSETKTMLNKLNLKIKLEPKVVPARVMAAIHLSPANTRIVDNAIFFDLHNFIKDKGMGETAPRFSSTIYKYGSVAVLNIHLVGAQRTYHVTYPIVNIQELDETLFNHQQAAGTHFDITAKTRIGDINGNLTPFFHLTHTVWASDRVTLSWSMPENPSQSDDKPV